MIEGADTSSPHGIRRDADQAGTGAAPSRGKLVRFTAANAWRQFSADHGTDLAAALTYYSVQALFPALLALVSLLGVFGDAQSTTNTLLDLIHKFMPGAATGIIEPVITSITNAKGSGIALIIGIIAATWSASVYIGAFGRAMNRVYGVPEGRPVWKRRPAQFLLTIVIEVMVALVLVALAVSGTIARAVFSLIGIGSFGLAAWNIAKWPVLLFVVVVIIALLYTVTPNVKHPRFRWMSIGAGVALLIWIITSVAFGFYVANFGRYNKTYGTLAGVIIMLLWLWLTNVALVLGGEVDAEIARTRQLQKGVASERDVQMPLKDDRGAKKAQRQEVKAEAAGRRIKLASAFGADRYDSNNEPSRQTELNDDGFPGDPDSK